MDEVLVEALDRDRRVGTLGAKRLEQVDEVLAHAHERQRAAVREVEPADQLLALRLGSLVERMRRRPRRRLAVAVDRVLDRRLVGAEIAGDVNEESEAVLLRQARVAVEDDARQRDARGLAAPRDQLARELDDIGDACPRMLVAARKPDQPAAALRDRRRGGC